MTSRLSNPFSTGGGGNYFEIKVQTAFLALMACDGFAPTFPQNRISKIQYQGKWLGFNMDDLIVYTNDENKLLIQIKHSVTFSKTNREFRKILDSAWRDFNNPEFNVEKDSIALITGQLSKTDIENTLTVLNWAKISDNAQDFYRKVDLTNFSSKGKRNKLEAFTSQIKHIDTKATDEDIFCFLKRFYLMVFDLDIIGSVNKFLLQTLLSQYYEGQAVLEYLQDVSQEYNINACSITKQDVDKKLSQKKFAKIRPINIIPDQLKPGAVLNDNANIKELALANLIGSWDENNENDRSIIAKIIGEDYNQWIKKIRSFLHQKNTSIELHNGIWVALNREKFLGDLALHIYNDELDNLKENAVIIFKEKDPKFKFKKSERWFANIQNKHLKHSASLRQGIAETIAIIGNNYDKLKHCDFGKREVFSSLIIEETFKHADWVLWGSLNNLLPILAQANPNAFLHRVGETIQQTPKLFIELFDQEGGAIMFGGSETTGLLWALEVLAWDENLFSQACMILADLAAIDSGGSTTKRPIQSLSTILLPWLPRTNASIDKRKRLVKTIVTERPSAAWNLLLTLLPYKQRSSMDTYRPTWLKVKIDDKKEGVLKKDYSEQCCFYAGLIVSMAKNNVNKLIILVENVAYLPLPAFTNLLEKISSKEITGLAEKERLPLYFALIDVITERPKFQNAVWALSSTKIKQVERVAEKLRPADLFNLHQRLFNGCNNKLFTENNNHERQVELLESKRRHAINEIFNNQGLRKIIELALTVDDSRLVGIFLGQIADNNIDKEILPKFLTKKNAKEESFIAGYSDSKYKKDGLNWLNSLDISNWSANEKVNLLKNISTDSKISQQASKWLGDQENLYWETVDINPYSFDDFKMAVDKLIQYKRPNMAIKVLGAMTHNNHLLDVGRSVKALLKAGQVTKEKKYDSFDINQTIEIIELLQKYSGVSQNDLFKIEWMYLASMIRVDMDIKPITLENKMATNPSFFCELVRHAYNSSNDTAQEELNEKEKNRAEASYNLLDNWKTIPCFTDGDFSESIFNDWLNSVKTQCEESGHISIALGVIGQALIHSPEDNSGLWINKTIAEVLDNKDSKHMRKGFEAGIINSRGVHTVDPTGAQEDKLAQKYLQQANELEQAGYINFAQTLKNISNSYEQDANRVRDKYRKFTPL